jgi:uncharacterized protein (UPF0332 family)
MDHLTFYTHASDLANRGTPADHRSAISRAYYAAHHAAVDFLRQIDVGTPAGPQAHGAVRNALLNSNDADVVRAGSVLRTLHSQRVDADYEWNDLTTEQQAEAHKAVQQAWLVLQALQTCLRDTVRRPRARGTIPAWVGSGITGLSLL